LANGFFDLQVNGYAGVDFNQNNLSAEDLHKACVKLKDDSVQGILATIITANPLNMKTRLHRLVQLREQDDLAKKIIYGFHIEGPFLSKKTGYRGAHPIEWLRTADEYLLKDFLNTAEGLIRIVTLAPEVDKGLRMTKMLVREGITVSAGHCNPGHDKLQAAIDAGLSMFTHLGNGCPLMLYRHDNIIQRVLSFREQLWLCFIADGVHIPFFSLKNYLNLVGYEKSVVVTDAMAAAAASPGKYKLNDLQLEVGSDRIVREPGKSNFAGSAITMQQSWTNLKENLGLSEVQCNRLMYKNPMNAIGITGN